ncbi:MAG: MFS transporter [Alphaproteobacteria bacterium]|nr:MFS transporter [Alphaproteobacteria bacterium]
MVQDTTGSSWGPGAAPGGELDSPASRRARVAWCLYDWANSSFPAVILTFVFAAYFTRGVAVNPVQGTGQWAFAMTVSALAVALASPVLGAIADRNGPRKPWLGFFSVVCIVATAALWFVRPHPDFLVLALVLVAIANIAFELGIVFYNAMLPEICPKGRLGRLSGWGWGLGYAGGLVCLLIILLGFVKAEALPFGLDRAAAEDVRIAAPIAAAWFALFAVPLFLMVPDRAGTGIGAINAVREGFGQLAGTFRALRGRPGILRFLIGRMIYTDGLNTLFIFGGVYAAGTWGMTEQEVILFGMLLNLTAGLGAAGFAWVDDWIGARRTILIALVGLTVLGGAILVVQIKLWFWIFGAALGIFFGPAQAASRSLMARIAPEEMRTEMFGLYALSGKATAFVGPALLGWVTVAADSQRIGMATVLVFFAAGFVILWPLRDPDRGDPTLV